MIKFQQSQIKQKKKKNFLFYFTPNGRAGFLLYIGLLSFAEGNWGIFFGFYFLFLSGFNFFLIQKHPGYKELSNLDLTSTVTLTKDMEPSSTKSTISSTNVV